MSSVQITYPAPDRNGTSILLDGVEMRERIKAGGMSVQFRSDGRPPLVTLTLIAGEFSVSADAAEVTVSDSTALLLEDAGWVRSVVSA